ncbi:MAG: hypothetical protein WAQ53_05970 [Thiofilum sp.]|uniref:hypothetical protein n=1 Tax=Thiofilum sp. TaxID=2212733 RepID=UPI0025FFCE36|nr:hypothetical protein [Thiofilum sp.]MBK8452239.1 hypothetical protein [Thiofilum sp.]
MTYFMNGVMEVINYPIVLLVLAALGLFLGQQSQQRLLTVTLPSFLIAVIVGLVLARIRVLVGNVNISTLVLAGLMALSTVLYLKPPLALSVLCAALSGLAVGLIVKPFLLPGFFGFKVYTTFAGVAFNATALLLSVLGIALVLKQFWEGVLVRAVASWIVASTLMVLVLSFTKVLKL